MVWLGARLGAEVVVVVVDISGGVMWTGLDGAEFLPSLALSDSPEHQYSRVEYSTVQYNIVPLSVIRLSWSGRL